MTELSDLRPGDIGFANITGGAGALVWLGQRLLAATERDEYKIKHVFMVTEVNLSATQAMIVQAMPNGAEEITIDKRWTESGFTYLRPAYVPGQASMAVLAARGYVGTPYSFLDYAAILGLHMGVENGRVRRYVTTSKHMICSQLVDQALSDAGVHVFNDGRLPQDVMPIELFRALKAMPGTIVL